MKLLEVFKDFPLKIRTYSGTPKNKITRTFVPKRKTLRVSKKRIQEFVEKLKVKYPNQDYRLTERVIKGVRYLVIRRGLVDRKNIPIFYAPKEAKWYVPSSYYKASHRLATYVMWMRLSNFGLLTSG
jgi:hypothetical protein